MAASNSSGGAGQLPKDSEAMTSTFKVNTNIPRRQLTLIAITVLLNVLLWTSLVCIVTTVYQIGVRPDDTTNIPSEVLTLTSALATIAYIVLHTIFSLKQRIWKHQRRHPSIVKKTSYIAVRVAVSLCILWLLTCGWNMITVARRPVCLPAGPSLLSWEAGTTCYAGRAGITFAMFALVASCTLFWMLSVVRRPFEAHLLKHGYRPPSFDPRLTSPSTSHKPSPSRSASFSDNHRRGRRSASTHWSTPSIMSNFDVETLDRGSVSPPPSIIAPSPTRPIGLGIFTSHALPPPLPLPFALPPRTSSIETPPDVFHPSASNQHLPLPPRMSTLVTPSGFVPLSNPAQFSASAWRAVHPLAPSPLGPVTSRLGTVGGGVGGGGEVVGLVASRSLSNLRRISSMHNLAYRSCYSRSSVSLTRPHRLSSTSPARSEGWSSRSTSTGPDEGRGSPSSGEGGSEYKASSNEVTYAVVNGTCIPGTRSTGNDAQGHMRHVSTPDVVAGAQEQTSRMSKGWKPQLKDQVERSSPRSSFQTPRSVSADLLSRFSPDTSPDDEKVSLRKELERNLDMRLSSERSLPVHKILSSDPLRYSPSPESSDVEARAKLEGRGRLMTFDEVKNKPLPKIAVL